MTTYTYDGQGNLRRVTLPDGRLIEYVIDGENRRVGKKVNGTLVRRWLYKDSLKPAAELDGSGAIVARYADGLVIKGANTYKVVADHLGTPRLLIDRTTGAVVQRLDFDEFGQVTSDSNPGFQTFGFAGGIYDPDTGLVRFGARDYDPAVGRWTAIDPIRFEGKQANLYSYVLSDPVNAIDPRGFDGFRIEPTVYLCVACAVCMAGVGGAAALACGAVTKDVNHALECGHMAAAAGGCLAICAVCASSVSLPTPSPPTGTATATCVSTETSTGTGTGTGP